MTYEMALLALSDPRRRKIFEGLRDQGLAVADIARSHDVSRPAISQHLKILTDAGLLTVTPKGTRRIYAINPEGLAPLRAYLDSFWDDTLSAFKDHVANTTKED